MLPKLACGLVLWVWLACGLVLWAWLACGLLLYNRAGWQTEGVGNHTPSPPAAPFGCPCPHTAFEAGPHRHTRLSEGPPHPRGRSRAAQGQREGGGGRGRVGVDAGVAGAGVQGCRGTGVQGYRGTGVQGYRVGVRVRLGVGVGIGLCSSDRVTG